MTYRCFPRTRVLFSLNVPAHRNAVARSVCATFFCAVLAHMATPVCAAVRIAADVVAPGGRSTSSAYSLQDVVGDVAVGASTGPLFRLGAGYRYAVGAVEAPIVTAAVFGGVSARVASTTVIVQWTLLAGNRDATFTVYRARGAATSWVRVGAVRIPGTMEYRDETVRRGTHYRYRVGAVNRDGEFFSAEAVVDTPAWATTLEPNVPNPFNPRTRIGFYLSSRAYARLVIYEAQGAKVRTLANRIMVSGHHEVEWDGTRDNGTRVASGVYFVRLRAAGASLTRKMVLLK